VPTALRIAMEVDGADVELDLKELRGVLCQVKRPNVRSELQLIVNKLEAQRKTASEHEADLQELKSILEQAKRPKVKEELQQMYADVDADLKQAREREAKTDQAPSAKEPDSTQNGASSSAPGPADAPVKPKQAPAAAVAVEPEAKKTSQAPAPAPVPVVVKSAGPWTEITTFALELGGYNSSAVTVDVRLKGIENLPSENVQCQFTESSFDLKIVGLDGVNYRMLKNNLDKDIVPAESSVRVKKNHVIVSLAKVKGEYGYDSWTDLCSKRARKPADAKKKDKNPQDGIMDMMKDLYEDGDDNMKKIIGEAMYKAQRGEKYEPKADDMKMPSLDSDI